jgi:Fe-S cluster assembly ATP-binding protein
VSVNPKKREELLEIKNLHAGVDGAEILKGVNLSVKAGELHAIMGPNGSGKSTLAQVLAGHPAFEVTEGSVTFEGQDLLAMKPEERAVAGLFLAFQYPVEIRGVTNGYFLQSAVNSVRKARGEEELDTLDFAELLEEKLEAIGWDDSLIHRAVNEGFSGGEKKRNEILQLVALEPKLAVLDETDSGLDIDAVRSVAEAVNRFRNEGRAFIVVTHYQRILEYLTPDHIHVLAGGRVVKSGGKELAHELEAKGYAWMREEVAVG